MALAHTDRAYESELKDLREKLLSMGGKVEVAISRCVRSVTERDSDLAQKVKEGEREINRLEVEIDDACRRLLALRQPAASDLRFITTALKIVTDLERMGDLAVNIAQRAFDLDQEQLRKALDAFVESDVQKAEEVMKGDELLDTIYKKLFNELLIFMMEDPRNIRRTAALMFVAKHLERLGDHTTNVAEMVIYMVRGTDLRHPRSRQAELERIERG